MQITPDTKIGALLENYPFLEEVLIEMAPQFEKLRNPVLRKTVARVTSLHHAAKVGGVNLAKLINTLRRNAGQEEIDPVDANDSGIAHLTGAQTEKSKSQLQSSKYERSTQSKKPVWFDPDLIVKSFDARESIDRGEQPIGIVMEQLKELADNQIMELITSFLPAPLIDRAEKKGYTTWSFEEEPDLVRTYFYRS